MHHLELYILVMGSRLRVIHATVRGKCISTAVEATLVTCRAKYWDLAKAGQGSDDQLECATYANWTASRIDSHKLFLIAQSNTLLVARVFNYS